MPLIKVHTNVSIDESKKKELLSSLSQVIVKGIGKPEQYVMATIEKTDMTMSASQNEAAFVEVKSIGGLNPEINGNISEDLCKLLEDSLNISPVRVYINFENVTASDWGWNGKTF